MWKAILSFFQALPMVVGLINRLIAMYQDNEARKAQGKSDEANKKMDDAKTPEEVWKANEEITRNLP